MSDKTLSLPLAKPITVHGEQIETLVYRPPTVEMAIAVGEFPYRFEGEKVYPRLNVVPDYLVLMADMPLSSVKQLDVVDLSSLAWELQTFFLRGRGQT